MQTHSDFVGSLLTVSIGGISMYAIGGGSAGSIGICVRQLLPGVGVCLLLFDKLALS